MSERKREYCDVIKSANAKKCQRAVTSDCECKACADFTVSLSAAFVLSSSKYIRIFFHLVFNAMPANRFSNQITYTYNTF